MLEARSYRLPEGLRFFAFRPLNGKQKEIPLSALFAPLR